MHFCQSGLSNETTYSIMTVAYMQNGALPNGTAVVPESSKDKWVVQKFGGEYVSLHGKGFAEFCQERAWANSLRT